MWRHVAAAAGLILMSLAVAAAYVAEPQTPQDFLDRLVLLVDGNAYEPHLRIGERNLRRAIRAEGIGADSLAVAFRWAAARAYARAGEAAPGPREALAANDRLSDAYLELGGYYMERGRGAAFGLGRDEESLEAAERVAACVVGLAPTRRRVAINAFLEELEEELERPPAGRCEE